MFGRGSMKEEKKPSGWLSERLDGLIVTMFKRFINGCVF